MIRYKIENCNDTSKPLRDFMYKGNRGKDIFFRSKSSLAVDKFCEGI